MTISDAELRKREDDRVRLEWNILRMHAGSGYKLSNEEALVLFRMLGDIMGRDGGKMFVDSPADYATAASLYVNLGAAMPDSADDVDA